MLFALPVVAFGAYGLVAAGAGLAAIRWAKTAENAVDYSVMNTGKQMLWLADAREEKYKAKQAMDSFFVRAGDLLAAGVVYAGTAFLDVGVDGFAAVNLVLVAAVGRDGMGARGTVSSAQRGRLVKSWFAVRPAPASGSAMMMLEYVHASMTVARRTQRIIALEVSSPSC